MGYVIVVLLAVLAGGLVYWASMRFSGDADAPGDGGDPTWSGSDANVEPEGRRSNEGLDEEGPPASSTDTACIPVLPTRGSWQGRLGGVMGLVIAVVIAAATTAFVLYEAGHFITKLLTDAANSG